MSGTPPLETAIPGLTSSAPEHHHDHPSPAARLAALVKAEQPDMWVVVAYAVVTGLLSLAVPIAVQALVNTVAFGVLRQPVLVLTLLVLGGLAFAGAMRAAQVQVVETLQKRLFIRATVDTAQRLARSSVTAFDDQHGPELVNRIFDVLTLQKSAATLLLDGLGIVLQVAIGALLMGFYHPLLLAFDVVLLASLSFLVFGLGRGAVKTSQRESKAKYKVIAWLQEVAQGVTLFRTPTGRALAIQQAGRLGEEYVATRGHHFRILFRQTISLLALHALASAALLGLGAVLVMERQLTLGQLVAAELVVSAMLVGISKLGKYLETTYDLLTAADKLGYLLDLPQEHSDGEPMTGVGPAVLKLRGVSYAYPGASRGALDNVSLTIEAGQQAGVFGLSGAGKSTLADLLVGLRAPTSGVVRIDGHDLRDLSLDDVRASSALVRGVELFEGTLLENLRAGREGISLEKIHQTLAHVGLLEDCLALPSGLQTPLGPRGAPLSDGQALLLTLARALVGSPRWLVIDGTLDGLDEPTQDRLLAALLAPDAPWTLVLLSCRRSLAARCRNPLHLDHGNLSLASTSQPAHTVDYAP